MRQRVEARGMERAVQAAIAYRERLRQMGIGLCEEGWTPPNGGGVTGRILMEIQKETGLTAEELDIPSPQELRDAAQAAYDERKANGE